MDSMSEVAQIPEELARLANQTRVQVLRE